MSNNNYYELAEHLAEKFKETFESVNKYGIKKGVDEKGIDDFVEHCARLTIASAVVTSPISIAGVPVDIAHTIFQQIRVTLAVIYYKTGTYNPSFRGFLNIFAMSLGVEMGTTVAARAAHQLVIACMIKVLPQILGRTTVFRLIPIASVAVVGTANYLFIKGIGNTLKNINMGDELREVA
ncbi:hypothetical protein [Merismopedia glauca]|nr:hypothetical protein [Merismopedia glauca]